MNQKANAIAFLESNGRGIKIQESAKLFRLSNATSTVVLGHKKSQVDQTLKEAL